jgi:hypothetical protein
MSLKKTTTNLHRKSDLKYVLNYNKKHMYLKIDVINNSVPSQENKEDLGMLLFYIYNKIY